MYLIINTSDPNITAEKIHATYDFPMEQIKLMPAKFHAAYENLTAEKDRLAGQDRLYRLQPDDGHRHPGLLYRPAPPSTRRCSSR